MSRVVHRERREERRLYQTRGQAPFALALGILFCVLSVAVPVALIVQRHFWSALVAVVIFAPMAWFYIRRGARLGIVADNEGVLVYNYQRKPIRVGWEEIERFRIGEKGLRPRVGLLELKDGRSITIAGIQGPHPRIRPSNMSAERMIDELNSALQAHHVAEEATATKARVPNPERPLDTTG